MTGGAFDVDGRRFVIPSPLAAVRPEDRLACAFFGGGTKPLGHDLLSYSLAAGSVDLSLVHTGRCPLLAEHMRCLDSLLGCVVSAVQDGPVLRSVVRFARTPQADKLFAMLSAGFGLNLSIGARILHAERVGDAPNGVGGIYNVTRWQLDEVSVVTFGRDQDAHLRRLGDDEDGAEMVARIRADAGGPARAAVRRALYLDRWQQWARVTGPKLAVELGLETNTICDVLEAEVGGHCAKLERDLAA